MIDLSLSEEQETFIDVVKAFATTELRPIAKECERSRSLPDNVLAQVRGLGLAMPAPEEYGGDGVLDSLTYLAAAEALGYGDAGIAYAALAPGLAALFIDSLGSDDQRATHLARLASEPSTTASLALYEGFGRQPHEFRTTCRRTGDFWVIDGRKESVHNPARADVSVVVAMDPDEGVLRAFVYSGTPDGLTVERDDREVGMLALGAAHTGVVRYESVRLPESALLGNGGLRDLVRAVSIARLLPSAIALGTSQATLDYAGEYSGTRIAFGKPISSFQAISFMLVDMHMAIESARLSLWESAWAIDTLDDLDRVRSLVTRTVARLGSIGVKAGRDGVQVLGGHGYMADHPVERWYRSTATLSAIDFDPLESDLAIV